MKKPELKDKDKDQNQTLAGEDKAEKKQGKGRRVNGNEGGEDKGLVTKKRSNNSKGMGVH